MRASLIQSNGFMQGAVRLIAIQVLIRFTNQSFFQCINIFSTRRKAISCERECKVTQLAKRCLDRPPFCKLIKHRCQFCISFASFVYKGSSQSHFILNYNYLLIYNIEHFQITSSVRSSSVFPLRYKYPNNQARVQYKTLQSMMEHFVCLFPSSGMLK